MLDWLTANCDLFGLAGQNWMLLLGSGFALYIAVLVIARHWQAGVH